MSTRDVVVERIVNASLDILQHERDYLRDVYSVDIGSEEELYKLPSYRLVDLLISLISIRSRK